MTNEHKAAIASGRAESGAVRDYLEALESAKPKPGRKIDPAKLAEKKESITEKLSAGGGNALKRLEMMQEISDIDQRLTQVEEEVDITATEALFVEHARSYAGRKGIQYSTWRQFGVSADVLSKAGITRGS